jgi:hypothetical protein
MLFLYIKSQLHWKQIVLSMKETPEAENNGYVVFKCNILGSAREKGGASTTQSRLLDTYLKTTLMFTLHLGCLLRKWLQMLPLFLLLGIHFSLQDLPVTEFLRSVLAPCSINACNTILVSF